MFRRSIFAASVPFLLAFTSLAHAQSGPVKRVGDAKSMLSSAVWVGDTVYLSGTMAPADYPPDKAKGTPAGYHGDTRTQAIGAIKAIQKNLQSLGLDLGDIVQMQAFLSGDPAKEGKMDLDGWNDAYRQFFGTPEQPNKPVRATVQVASLVLPTGRIEIMVIAARHPAPSLTK
jgi:enamine deaminase RidA (YjgF/YER057c/UK114 family)